MTAPSTTAPQASPDVVTIGAGLTAAERLAVTTSFTASWGETFVRLRTTNTVRAALLNKGLLSPRSTNPFNQLGLAVRAHLASEK